jgi:hypothetical protein
MLLQDTAQAATEAGLSPWGLRTRHISAALSNVARGPPPAAEAIECRLARTGEVPGF